MKHRNFIVVEPSILGNLLGTAMFLWGHNRFRKTGLRRQAVGIPNLQSIITIGTYFIPGKLHF